MTPVQLAPPAFAAPARVRRMSDAVLAQRLAAGDRWALDELYVRHAGALRGYARRLLGDAHAEDAVHDALAATQRALLGRGRVVDVRPWLFRCVRNVCLSELDRAGRRHEALPADAAAAGGEDVSDVAARNERVRRALEGLAQLPDRQRQALARRVIDGEGYDTLAAHFALTENAAQQLVHRARRNVAAYAA
jgi:RNA polymerase sigma-70 factor (ECF subfamily)